jgi:hypothetical protein
MTAGSSPALLLRGPTNGLRAVTNMSFVTTSSTTITKIPGATISVIIPQGERGTIMIFAEWVHDESHSDVQPQRADAQGGALGVTLAEAIDTEEVPCST